MATESDSTPGTVSVVVPAYNCAAFVEETIESIYEQSALPKEVIVINDGSTDDTDEVLHRLALKLPDTFRCITRPNGGSAAARNSGIALATGDLVAFLDHDDLWLPRKLAAQLEQFAAEADLSLSFTGLKDRQYESGPDGSLVPAPIVEERVAYIDPEWSPEPEAVLRKLMPYSPIGSLSTVMVRREVFDVIGPFDERLSVVDDWLMWLKMAAAGLRFGHVPEALVEHRSHSANLSGDPRKLWIDMCLACDEFLPASRLPRAVRREMGLNRWCAFWHLNSAIEELRAGNSAEARRHLARAARIRPLSVRPGWIRLLGVGPPPGSRS